MRRNSGNLLLDPFTANFLLMEKPGSWFTLAKSMKSTRGRVTFYIKMQVNYLHLYLKCHSSTGIFPRFYWCKSSTWFLHHRTLAANGLRIFGPLMIFAPPLSKPFHRPWILMEKHFLLPISDALHDLVPFVRFKKRKKHSLRSVNFSKVAGWSLQLY